MLNDSSNHAVEPVAEPTTSSWRIAIAGLLSTLGLFFGAQIFGGIMIGVYGGLQHWSLAQTSNWLSNSVTGQFAYSVLVYGPLLVGIWLMIRLFHWRWTTIGIKMPAWWHPIVGILAVVPYYVLLTIAILLVKSSIFPSLNLNQQQDIGFNDVHGALQLALTFVSLAIIPPLVEEITMRGFLYSSLKRWLPTLVAAFLVSILFAVPHLLESSSGGLLWVAGIDTFILSFILISLREMTGNLWAGITLHALKNTVAFVQIYLVLKR